MTFSLILSFMLVSIIISNMIKNISSVFIYLCIPLFIFTIISKTDMYLKSIKMDSKIYKHIPVNIELKDRIEKVSKYIETSDKTIYILDFTAAIYNLNINRYNKYFDLFMNGNFGINGEKEIFNIIDNEEQVFMISNFTNNNQTPTDIINYVKGRYHFCGNYETFDLFCK